MKLKYAFHEQKKNKVMTVLMFFQTVIVLMILISIISAITSRYERYKPLEKFFRGDGLSMDMSDLTGRNGEPYLPFTESSDVEKYLKKAHVVATYEVSMTFDIDHTKEVTGTWSPVIAYDDELLAAYTPKLEAGRWLQVEDADTDMIEIVLAQTEDCYKVGDIITLTTSEMIKESRDCKLSEAVQAKVVGILADEASLIMSPIMGTDNYGQYADFRDYFYYPLGRDKTDRAIVFVSKRDIEHNNQIHADEKENFDKEIFDDVESGFPSIWQYIISGPCFIQYDADITQEEKDYNSRYLMIYGSYSLRQTSSEMRQNSMQYIMNQMDMLIPVLIAMILLTLMSIVSSTVIMIRQNMHNYAVYYMMGLTWRQCVAVHGASIFILQFGVFLFTMIGIIICEKIGAFDQTLFSLGGWQVLGCLAVTVLFIAFSYVLSFLLIGKKSAKDILREVE